MSSVTLDVFILISSMVFKRKVLPGFPSRRSCGALPSSTPQAAVPGERFHLCWERTASLCRPARPERGRGGWNTLSRTGTAFQGPWGRLWPFLTRARRIPRGPRLVPARITPSLPRALIPPRRGREPSLHPGPAVGPPGLAHARRGAALLRAPRQGGGRGRLRQR